MKTYLKPEIEVVDASTHGVFADNADLVAYTTESTIHTIRAKRNNYDFDDFEFDDEDDGFGW